MHSVPLSMHQDFATTSRMASSSSTHVSSVLSCLQTLLFTGYRTSFKVRSKWVLCNWNLFKKLLLSDIVNYGSFFHLLNNIETCSMRFLFCEIIAFCFVHRINVLHQYKDYIQIFQEDLWHVAKITFDFDIIAFRNEYTYDEIAAASMF